MNLRVLTAECPTDHKEPRAHQTSPSTRKKFLERQSLCSLKKKNLKISDSQKLSHQINLDPLDYQELQRPLTQRLFFYSLYSGIAEMCSLPFCGRLEALPACHDGVLIPLKKYFQPPQAPGELVPLSLLCLTMGAAPRA